MRGVHGCVTVMSLAATLTVAVPAARGYSEVEALLKQVTALEAAGKFTEATALANQLEAQTKAQFGDESKEHAVALSWLGGLLKEDGHLFEAEPPFKRALAIDAKVLGSDHPNVGRDLGNLANLLEDQGRLIEAEPLLRRALAIDEKSLGPDHPTVALALNNLAELYHVQGRLAEAEPLFKRAQAIDEKTIAPNQLTVVMHNLASLYQDQGRLAEAEPLFKHALAIDEKELGPDHPSVALALDGLANLYHNQGRLAEAEPLLKRALAIDKKLLGPGHPDVGSRLNNLAALYMDQGRLAEAEPLLKRALEIAEKALGQDHPRVGMTLDNLAQLYQAQGRLADAEPLYKRALQIKEKTLGPDHSEVGITVNNLATLYEDLGRLPEAEPLYKRALAIQETTLGPDHPKVATAKQNLGSLYLSTQRASAAEPLLLAALMVEERSFGAGSPQTAYVLSELGDLYHQLGQCQKADGFFGRSHAAGLGADLFESPIFFATSRKRDESQAALAFSAVPDTGLSFGRITVVVPTDELRALDLEVRRAAATKPGHTTAPITTAQRMALTCPIVEPERLLFEAARKTAAAATHNRSEALVYIHGYNNSFEDSARRAGQIAYDLHFDGPTFAFSWPSQNSLLDYFVDSRSANDAAPALRDLLAKIIAEVGVRKIHIIAHSMGNVVLIEALRLLLKDDPKAASRIGEVIDASPDVDPQAISAVVAAFVSKGPRFTVYASRNDWALLASSLLHTTARAGFIGDEPLIVPGVDTVDVSNTGLYFGLNHDLYASNPTLVADMRRLISAGIRPPDMRSPDFEAVTIAEGTYWRLRVIPAQQ